MKNALFGYTYQQHVNLLLLALMDVERRIDEIEIEASVDHKFDDVILHVSETKYALQIKDIEGIRLDNLSVSLDQLFIKGKPHKLARGINVVFFKHIDIKSTCRIFGFKAYLLNGIYLVSLSREAIEKHLAKLYKAADQRRQVIQLFFSKKLDDRILKIKREQLPSIPLLDMDLIEKSIKVSRKILDFESILVIEGKPGVGKSHLVALLQQHFEDTILYRFWISNQDRDYEQRLKYSEFLSDLSKRLFHDLLERTEAELIDKLSSINKTLIIDGLDHVENYRNTDLHCFVEFFNQASAHCKIIVLTRPLNRALSWKKQILNNWNRSQTSKVLKQLYHIDNYSISDKIYKLTKGYPILVKYITEQYKIDGSIPSSFILQSVTQYYDAIFRNESGKKALALFLCCRGYFMKSELGLFLGAYAGSLVEEFINDRPYLFEIKLNRISLYHDSLLTYLRNSNIDFRNLLQEVEVHVTSSLLKNETRFQSRISHFDLSTECKVSVIQHYASIDRFNNLVGKIVDYEALAEFYVNLREILCDICPEVLEIHSYYDFGLILNLVTRDHISAINGFYYTYVNLLLEQGYSEDDITSSGYLFGMLLYIRNQDASYLYNLQDDSHYDTSRFYEKLQADIHEEEDFFDYQLKPFKKKAIENALKDHVNFHYSKLLKDALVNIYIHPSLHKLFPSLYTATKQYLSQEEFNSGMTLGRELNVPQWRHYQYLWVLREVEPTLLSLGYFAEHNDYLNLSLKDYLQKHCDKGSFTMREEILSYLRLALHNNTAIDITSISAFWTKYHQRKDYSLHSLDYALSVFEKKSIVHWKDAVKLIAEIQEISEKGYRWLLGGYLMLKEPAFLKQLFKEFDYRLLRIEWFQLPPEYIQALPDKVFHHALAEVFEYNRHSQQLEVSEIINVLNSSRIGDFKKANKIHGYSVTLKIDEEGIDLLDKHKIPYKLLSDDRKYSQERSVESRFAEGVLDLDSQDLIKSKGMQPAEVALYGDGNRSALGVPEIFSVFSYEELQLQMKSILYNTITSRSKLGNYFNSTWHLPGTMLQLLLNSQAEVDYDRLFESFKCFVNLSMFKIERITHS